MIFTEEKKKKYLPKDQRKKILLLSDDLRMPSGVGTMSREMVLATAHRYNWAQLGAAINHPDFGRVMDASESLSNDIGISDAYLKIYPYNGYGDADILRNLMAIEKPDMIIHFTDPRYWIWLYHLEHEIRTTCPLVFYTIWDDLPVPKYNKLFYESCDALFSISRQTHNITRQVVSPEKWTLI
jgi:hypothetical protein